MGHANAPLMGMQGPHRHREAAQWVILHSAVVLLAGQILSTCLHHAFFLLYSGDKHERKKAFVNKNYHVIFCVCDCEGSSRHVHKTIGDSLAG